MYIGNQRDNLHKCFSYLCFIPSCHNAIVVFNVYILNAHNVNLLIYDSWLNNAKIIIKFQKPFFWPHTSHKQILANIQLFMKLKNSYFIHWTSFCTLWQDIDRIAYNSDIVSKLITTGFTTDYLVIDSNSWIVICLF